MKLSRLIASMLSGCLLLGSFAANAQQQVLYQQRIFEKYGDGSATPTTSPCCTPNGTFDQRVTGRNDGPYFDEFKLRTQTWYGTYQPTGGVSLRQGAFTTSFAATTSNPGGVVLKAVQTIMRTVEDQVFKAGSGPGNYTYIASANPPSTPTFRDPGTWLPASNNGFIQYSAGPNQYGGTRGIIGHRLAIVWVAGTAPGVINQVSQMSALGPGLPFTSQNVARRSTRTAPFLVRSGSFSGPVLAALDGTAWFTVFPYTTGMVNALANTIGTELNDFTTRTDTGFNSLMTTAMGGITGQLQLVSALLLNSRGAIANNLAGTNLTIITFMPEPGSAALIGAGALGLLGLGLNDRRRNSVLRSEEA